MPYVMNPLASDPARPSGLSERLVVSHLEHHYGGAVKRLDAIEETLAALDFSKAPFIRRDPCFRSPTALPRGVN